MPPALTTTLVPIADVRDVYVPRQDHRSTHSVMILGMHWAPETTESDTLRLREMMADDWSIATADNHGHFDTAGHVTIWFKSVGAIERLVRDYPQAQLYALDYFWLQVGYYKDNYGENWPEKAAAIFASGWRPRAVILPIDAVEDPRRQTSSMRQQMKRLASLGLSYFEIGVDDELHPLVKSSMRVEDALFDRVDEVEGESSAMADFSDVTRKQAKELIKQGRVHSAQTWRLDGFVVIVRRGTVRGTRAWLRAC